MITVEYTSLDNMLSSIAEVLVNITEMDNLTVKFTKDTTNPNSITYRLDITLEGQ